MNKNMCALTEVFGKPGEVQSVPYIQQLRPIMPYDIKYNSTLRIIELSYTGILSEDIRKSTEEIIQLQKDHGVYSILHDAMDVESAPSVAAVLTCRGNMVKAGLADQRISHWCGQGYWQQKR